MTRYARNMFNRKKEDFTYGFCCSAMRCLIDADAMIHDVNQECWYVRLEIPGFLMKVPELLQDVYEQQNDPDQVEIDPTKEPTVYMIHIEHCPFCGIVMDQNTVNKNRLDAQDAMADFLAGRIMDLSKGRKGLKGKKDEMVAQAQQAVEEYYSLYIEQ